MHVRKHKDKKEGLKMKMATFKGGIHPYDGKELSKSHSTKILLPQGDLVFPMSQHIGAPAKPLVKKGDKVLVGQRIGESSGFISANICSSISGMVKAVEPRLTVSGAMIESIIIENDHEYLGMDGLGEKRDYKKLSKDEIRNAVKDAGIVGMGGAGFPTHVKLTPKDDLAIDYLIVNSAECEPYLTSDYRMLLEETEKIIIGLKIILSLFPNAKGIIAVEDNKADAIEKLEKLLENEPNIDVKGLKTKYPQGAEKALIYACTGRKLNSTLLPSDVGCIVNNTDTMIAIYSAVVECTPSIRRIITVTGDAIKNPCNFNVKTGTNYRELAEAAGGFKQKPEKIISGGPMMGMAMYSLDVPVTKTSSALLCFTKDEVAANEETACIRCGRCVEVCACNLVPQKMMEYAERFDTEGYEKWNGMECYECGSCAFVCPAKRRLTQAFKETKRTILDNRRKK